MVLIDHRDRVFQVWAYTVGMGRLLLRSTKSDCHHTRVDVLFQNVKAMKLPTTLHGLIVSAADDDQSRVVMEVAVSLTDDETKFFIVAGSFYEGYVAAGVVTQIEDKGEYFESSDLWPVP